MKLSGALQFTARSACRSPRSRSNWLRISQPKPLSPSRTRGCSDARLPRTVAGAADSDSRRSQGHQPFARLICRWCSTPWLHPQRSCAEPKGRRLPFPRVSFITASRATGSLPSSGSLGPPPACYRPREYRRSSSAGGSHNTNRRRRGRSRVHFFRSQSACEGSHSSWRTPDETGKPGRRLGTGAD